MSDTIREEQLLRARNLSQASRMLSEKIATLQRHQAEVTRQLVEALAKRGQIAKEIEVLMGDAPVLPSEL